MGPVGLSRVGNIRVGFDERNTRNRRGKISDQRPSAHVVFLPEGDLRRYTCVAADRRALVHPLCVASAHKRLRARNCMRGKHLRFRSRWYHTEGLAITHHFIFILDRLCTALYARVGGRKKPARKVSDAVASNTLPS